MMGEAVKLEAVAMQNIRKEVDRIKRGGRETKGRKWKGIKLTIGRR